MKEIEEIISSYDKLDKVQQRVALATVINVEGSSYRRTGARMLVQENGIWVGGISGGCLEGDALKKAKYSITQNKVSVVTYDTSEDDEHQIGVGLGCNGVIDVLLSPIRPEDDNNPIEKLRSCLGERKVNILLTVISCGEDCAELKAGDMIKYVDQSSVTSTFKPDLGEALLADIENAFGTQQSVIKSYGLWKIFIEVLQPPVNVVLFGSNYDVYPLLKIGREMGWRIDVVTNPHKAGKEMFKLSNKIIPKEILPAVDDYTAFILMAHDFKTDKNNLARALSTKVPYIGLLGPAKRSDKIIKELKEEGVQLSQSDHERLYYPTGLDIGANSPEEIAVAILAEISAHFSGRTGGFLKFREGTIHERAEM